MSRCSFIVEGYREHLTPASPTALICRPTNTISGRRGIDCGCKPLLSKQKTHPMHSYHITLQRISSNASFRRVHGEYFNTLICFANALQYRLCSSTAYKGEVRKMQVRTDGD